MGAVTFERYRLCHQGVNEDGIGCRATDEDTGISVRAEKHYPYEANKRVAAEALRRLLVSRTALKAARWR